MFFLMGWLAIAALFVFAVWTVAVLTAGILIARPKHLFLIWLGVPALCLLVLIGLSEAMSFYHSLPGVVFPDSVGFTPTPDVVIVNSLRHDPIDSDDSYLEFYASDSTIDRILQDGFAQIPPADFVEIERNIERNLAPAWWSPPTGPNVRVYASSQDKDRRSGFSQRLLIYDLRKR